MLRLKTSLRHIYTRDVNDLSRDKRAPLWLYLNELNMGLGSARL